MEWTIFGDEAIHAGTCLDGLESTGSDEKPPPELSETDLAQCKNVEAYMAALDLKSGGESNAEMKPENARGRGLVAAKDLEAGEAILAERALIVVSNDGGKMENAIQFALAAELPENASKVNVLQDLCNTFDGEVEVFDDWMLEALDEDRPPNKQKCFSIKELNHFVGIYCSNAHQMSASMTCGMVHLHYRSLLCDVQLVAGVFPAHAMCNHSCTPNVEFISSEEGKYIRMVAETNLKKGEELHISYLSREDIEKDVGHRREILLENFGFECICTRCLKDTTALIEKPTAAKNKRQKRAA